MRIAALDGMRGLAALGIMTNHAGWQQYWTFTDWFLVLSGFLVGTTFFKNLKSETFSLKNFYIRRALQLWPLYYLLLIAMVVATYILQSVEPDFRSPQGWLESIFFLQFTPLYSADVSAEDYSHYFLTGFAHTWTLAAIEQFYVLLPMILWLIGVGVRRVVLLSLLAIAVSVCARWHGMSHYLLITHLDGFAVGLLLAVFVPKLKKSIAELDSKSLRFGVSSGIVFLLIAGFIWGHAYWGGMLLQYLFPTLAPAEIGALSYAGRYLGGSAFYGMLVLSVLVYPNALCAQFFCNPLFRYLGQLSWPLYIFHFPVTGVVNRLIDETALMGADPLATMGYFGLSFVLAIAWHHLIEPELLKLKERFPLHKNHVQQHLS